MRLPIAAPVAALLLAGAASSTAAGPLAQTVRGVENRTESPPSRPPSDPPSSPPTTPPVSDHRGERTDHYVYVPDADDCYSCAPVYLGRGGGTAVGVGSVLPGPGRVDLYLGAHPVVGSDGAIIGEVRASKSWLGIAASNTSYFERIEAGPGEAPGDKPMSESIRMDLTAVALGARLFAAGGSEAWLEGGLGASGSSEYDTLYGTAFTLRGEHAFGPQLRAVGQGRLYGLQEGVRAYEGWVGLRAWFLSIGYRSTKFNVGPALHGPEAGVALRF